MATSPAQRSWFRAAPADSGVISRSSSGPPSRDAPPNPAATPWSFPPPLDGYVCLQEIASAGRAEVSIGVGAGEPTLDRLVIIKRYAAGKARATPGELELAAALEHANIVRTLRISRGGADADDYAITEYLDGVTASELLAWAAVSRREIPALAVRRILTSLLDAVRHGQRVAASEAGRGLCELPITSGDVFVTYDGRVKVLGFKAYRQRAAAEAEPIVDALLSRHWTPGLTELLDRYARDAWGSDLDALISSVTSHVRPRDRGGEDRVALARLMASVDPLSRARRAGRLVAAFARWRAAQELDGPPSGVRRRS